MKKLINEDLRYHTTFRLGGPSEMLVIPESEADLISYIRHCIESNTQYRLLGKGSNVLVPDAGIKGHIIKNTKACLGISIDKDIVEVGASVSLQNFVKFCVNHNREAMEYLYSIPGTVGGAIYTNAGRGQNYNKQISDKLVSVRVFDGHNVFIMNRDDGKFSYRASIFKKNKNFVILSAVFKLGWQNGAVGKRLIIERMKYVHEAQDRKYSNAGTIFRKGNNFIFYLLRGKKAGGAEFSRKTLNWINVHNGASSKDVMDLILRAKFLHHLLLQKCQLEIEVWK